MAPDKIYIEIRHPFGNEYTEIVGFEDRGNSEDIEYIRKDALMELIKEESKFWDDGEMIFRGLIDKLNSM